MSHFTALSCDCTLLPEIYLNFKLSHEKADKCVITQDYIRMQNSTLQDKSSLYNTGQFYIIHSRYQK